MRSRGLGHSKYAMRRRPPAPGPPLFARMLASMTFRCPRTRQCGSGCAGRRLVWLILRTAVNAKAPRSKDARDSEDGEGKTGLNQFTHQVKVPVILNPCVLVPLRHCAKSSAFLRMTLVRRTRSEEHTSEL